MENVSHNTVYTCPMHPEVQSGGPGMCGECGMALVPSRTRSAGHDAMAMPGKHEGHDTSAFGRKALISALLSIPVILYSNLPEELFGWSAPSFSGSSYLALAFSSVIFFYGGFVFLKGAWIELRGRLPGMMTLISVAITAAYLWSVAAVFLGKGDVLFWELATLITVMLVGHWLEMRAVKGAQSALKELSKLLPDTAEVLRGGRALVVPLSEVREGDMVVVRPGAKISADGVVAEGSSEVDESIATGESKPVPKKKESEVIAGTVNGDGSLTVKVTKIGEHTFLAGVMRLVREAEASKSRLQILSDRAAFYLTIIATAAGTATLAVWLGAGSGVGFAVERMVAVLVIACPHALGLAVPLVASISTTKAAKSGFLVKRRLALEAARAVDTVLFDKTGTLTKGEYGVVKVLKGAVQDEKEILRLAASVNAHSEHAAGKGAVSRARELGISFLPVKDFARVPGKGAEGVVEGAKVCVGGEAIIEYAGARLSPELERQVRSDAKKGWTMNYVIRREEILGVIALADVIRQESREATQALKAMGVRVAMVTGDSEDVARWVAEELSIGEYFARVLPHEKSEKVKLLQLRGRKVAMVGDGVNDAPALTQADVGIAIGAGTNVAIEPAGIILVRNDPRDIVKIVRLSRMTYTKMAQNLFWATVYNLAALPLAAGVLASQGILLQPALAAVFMSLSTVIVAVNAVFLRRAKL